MPKQREVLRKIVALKRQSAEQRVRVIQIEMERIEAFLQTLIVSLQDLDDAKSGFDALQLAQAHGYPSKLIADIGAARTALTLKRAELHVAREALKHVFHSQERLGEAGAQG